MDYPGKVIRKTPVTPTQTSASGVWTVDDALQAVKTNTWPIAGVPNPISRSLRFNSADSTYLNRTPGSASNRRTFTWSGWVKRSTLSTNDCTLFNAGTNISTDSGFFGIRFNSSDQLNVTLVNNLRTTTQVFRDVSSWYHIVVALDTTQGTAANRVKIYVNGSEVTQFASSGDPTQNLDTAVNNNVVHEIGRTTWTGTTFYNGYLTEINFIDGSALTPSDFGLTDPQTGQWVPKKYTGTYGTNGFYLNFKDNSSTGTLGYDYSGNGNNWTANNFSVTAGAGNDSLVDVPTPWIAYNTTGDVGGVFRGNYCTLNPLAISTSDRTYTNGNLEVSISVNNLNVFGSMQIPTTGKWYWEHQITTIGGGSAPMGGVAAGFITDLSNAVVYRTNGDKIVNGSGSAYGATYTTTDIIGVAVNVDSGTVTFYKNGSSQGAITFSAGGLFPLLRANAAPDAFVINFGQRPFAYTPPAGFVSLCTTNLPTPTIGATSTTQAGKYFNTVLYTGNNSTLAVTGVGFQPDWVWIKQRSASATFSNAVIDAVRGRSKNLITNLTNAETTSTSTKDLTSFDSDGFSLGQSDNVTVNDNAATYVAWNWNAGGSNQTISVSQYSSNVPSIASTVRANTTAGFSIVTYTGNATAGATIGHGLGVAPSMIIVKDRVATSGAREWVVYHSSLGNTQAVFLSTTGAAYTGTNLWNNTSPTSTVFTVGNSSEGTNGSGNAMLAYCFAPVAGYSAFGSYTGNGVSNGPFIYTGFRPRYVMIKNSSNGSAPWYVLDTARSPYNEAVLSLNPNSSAAEVTDINFLDINSNGFKVRTDGSYVNGNTNTIIYAAFAEFPFKFSNAR